MVSRGTIRCVCQRPATWAFSVSVSTCQGRKNTSCVIPGKKKTLFNPLITTAPKKRPVTQDDSLGPIAGD